MSEDIQKSPEYERWVLKSRLEENKENSSVMAHKQLRKSNKRVALGARIEIDENIRKKYEPTGCIPKRFGKLSIPSTSSGDVEQLKIPQTSTATGNRQGDAGVFGKSKFLVFDEEMVQKSSKLDIKPITEEKKLNMKFMRNSSIPEKEVPMRMTQKAYNRAKDFFQNREQLASSREGPEEKEMGIRRWNTVHSIGESNRKLLGDIQNLEPVKVQQIIQKHCEHEETSSEAAISSEEQESSGFSKDGKDEEMEPEGAKKRLRGSMEVYPIEENTSEPLMNTRGPVNPRIQQLIKEYFEVMKMSHDIPAPVPQKKLELSKDDKNQEVKIEEMKKKRERLRRYADLHSKNLNWGEDIEPSGEIQDLPLHQELHSESKEKSHYVAAPSLALSKDDQDEEVESRVVKQKREFKRLNKLHFIEESNWKPSAKDQGLVHPRVQQLIEQDHCSEARETPNDVPPPLPEKIKILHKSAQDPEEEGLKRNAVLEKDEVYSLYADDFIIFQKEKDVFRSFTPNWRAINASSDQRKTVVHFLIRLGTSNAYPSHILYQTVRIFDDVLQAMRIPLEKLQLMIISSLWIVLKKDYIVYRIPGAQKMSKISNGLYTAEDVKLAEVKILMALNFQLTYPDPFSLLTFSMATMNNGDFLSPEERESIYYFGGYMIDLALLDEDLMKTSSILLASAAAELATTLTMEPEDTLYCTLFSRWRSPYATQHLKDEDITYYRALLIRNITESCYKTSKSHIVYKKYCRSRYGKVSARLIHKIQQLVPPNF